MVTREAPERRSDPDPSESPGSRDYHTEGVAELSLEARRFPDEIHHLDFPSVVLSPGDSCLQVTVYASEVDES